MILILEENSTLLMKMNDLQYSLTFPRNTNIQEYVLYVRHQICQIPK